MRSRRHVATVSIPMFHNSSTIEELLVKLEHAVKDTDVQNQHARAQCNANYMGMIEVKIDNICKVTGGMLHTIERIWEKSNVDSVLQSTTVNPSTKEGCSVLQLLADCSHMAKDMTRKPRASWCVRAQARLIKYTKRIVLWVSVLCLCVACLMWASGQPLELFPPPTNASAVEDVVNKR